MTIQQALNEIKARSKPYVGIMPQTTFSNTIRNIEAGLTKPNTVVEFMLKFGYKVTNEIKVEKI